MLACCAHTIQHNAIQSLAAKITATWHSSIISPSHLPAMKQCSSLWMNHCKESRWDGTEVTEGSAGIQCFIIRGLLRYTPVVSLRVLDRRLQISKYLHQTSIMCKDKRCSLTRSFSPHLENVNSGDPGDSKPSFSFTNHHLSAPNPFPNHHPELPRIHEGLCKSCRSFKVLYLYLCQPDHHWHKVKKKKRGVSHIWVLSNTMAHCDQKATENNPYSENIVPIQLVWLWDNAMIPYCHLRD